MRLFGPNGEPEPVSDTSPASLIGPVCPKPVVVMTNGAAIAPAPASSELRRVNTCDDMAVPLFDVLSMIAAISRRGTHGARRHRRQRRQLHPRARFSHRPA